MEGFFAAMNPSLGLVGCCDCREDKFNDEMQLNHGVTSRTVRCGVGIDFRQDKTGALYVSALVPHGAYTKKYERNTITIKSDSCNQELCK
jgi:hypothetical protein